VKPAHEIIDESRSKADLSVKDLWTEYFALGGSATPLELDAFLNGALELPSSEYDKAAHALNECFMVRGQNHPVPYFADL
jgi:hypothetical protein